MRFITLIASIGKNPTETGKLVTQQTRVLNNVR